MRIGRTLPPAASPIPWSNIINGFISLPFAGKSEKHLFEQQLQSRFHTDHCFLLSSGKAAMTILLQALHDLYPARNEVVIPAFTCYSVPASIKKAGLKIVLCDTAPHSFDFDKKKLTLLLEERADSILCLMPTHFYGIAVELPEHNCENGSHIPIIEDAAQSMGEKDNAQCFLGTRADAGFFSLGRGKALSCVEGGIILTDRSDLAQSLSQRIESLPSYSFTEMVKLLLKATLANLLIHPSLYWLPRLLPFLRLGETIYEKDFVVKQFSPIQRSFAKNWLKTLEKQRNSRLINADCWFKTDLDSACAVAKRESSSSMIRLPFFAPSKAYRDHLISISNSMGLGIMPAYPSTINMIPQIQNEFSGQHFPNAEKLTDHLFTIPVHSLVNERDYEKIRTIFYQTEERFST